MAMRLWKVTFRQRMRIVWVIWADSLRQPAQLVAEHAIATALVTCEAMTDSAELEASCGFPATSAGFTGVSLFLGGTPIWLDFSSGNQERNPMSGLPCFGPYPSHRVRELPMGAGGDLTRTTTIYKPTRIFAAFNSRLVGCKKPGKK